MQVTDEENSNQNLVLPVDQHFNVKGVGLVAIGYVQSGSINKHDNVLILPANENGVVRSLQVMDDDVDVAVAGDRVGVALRNLREGALNRGCMICHPESDALVRHDKSKLKLKKAPFQKRNVSIDDVVHAAVDLQFVVGRVTSLEDENITVKWDSTLWIRKDSSPSIIISQLDAMPMRILGNVDEIILD
jgi:selenocysteine-specific elongation factor